MKRETSGKIIGIVFASAVLAAGAFFAFPKKAQPVVKDVYALDTFCTITIYGGTGDPEAAAQKGTEELKRLDALMDAEKEDSDLWRINHRTEDTVRISAETAEMLSGAKQISQLSGGTLWPAIRPLTELWDFKNAKTIPDDDRILAARTESQSGQWDIENGCFVSFVPETKIEAGAFAKGYIADRIREVLLKEGVTSAIIDLGGNIHTIGKNADGRPFRIGIRDPEGSDTPVDVIEAENISVVTAGTYERFIEQDGVRYHHILDPETGYPARTGLSSVTVCGPSSFVCDALATAFLVAGKEKAEKILETYNKENLTSYQAYFLESGDTD